MPPLLDLHLRQAIPYVAQDGLGALAQEGLRAYSVLGIISMGPDGPSIDWEKRGPALFDGYAAGPLAPIAPKTQGKGARPGYFLGPGDFAFRQLHDAKDEELGQEIECFLRDAWWEGRRLCGELILRRVPEDGKIALQIIQGILPN